METKHTKGEWVVTQTERVECNNEIVALVYDGTANPTSCENIDFVAANAKLISAAPDLLEALIDLYESLPDGYEDKCLPKVRKVIKKAIE